MFGNTTSRKKEYIFEITISLILGLLVFALFFGIKSLNVCNDEWIFRHSGDLTEHYLGWRFFRNSRWFLPIGSAENIAWPDNISIIYLDCIPWMAILFKLLSPALPATFQYMGIYELFCFSMQIFLGMEIVKACIIKNSSDVDIFIVLSIIFGGLFLGVSAPMINRVFYHTALSSHYLFLWALLLWIKNDEKTAKARYLSQAALGAMCTLTHLFFVPIIGVMLIGLFAIDLFRGRNAARVQMKKSVPDILSYVAGAFIAFALLGGFDDSFNPSGVGAGFYGANLNALINPMGYSQFVGSLPVATGGQYEGFSYLGLGWILLAVLSLIILFVKTSKINNTTDEHIKNNKAIIGAFAGFIFLYIIAFAAAAGTIVGINDKIIFEPVYPYPIDLLLNIFRSHGRFTWAVAYAIPVLAVIIICRLVNNKGIIAFTFVITAAIQIVDFSPKYSDGDNWYEGYDPYMESIDAWEYIAGVGAENGGDGQGYYNWNIVFLPDGLDYSQHNKLFEIADWAADYGMTLDNYYYARPRGDYVRARQEVIKNNLDLGYEYDNLLVVFDDVFEPVYHNWKLHYYCVNNIVIGTGKRLEGLSEIDYGSGIPVDITLKRNIEYGQKLEDGSVLVDFTGSISGPEWRLNTGHYRYTVCCEDPLSTTLLYNSNVDDGYIENITTRTVGSNIIEYEFDVPEDALGMTLFVRNDAKTSRRFYSALLTRCD